MSAYTQNSNAAARQGSARVRADRATPIVARATAPTAIQRTAVA